MIRAILVTLLLVSTAQAETIDVRNAKLDVCGSFELYHINGVMTDINGAQENLNRIQQVYGNAYNGHLIKYALAYNQHRDFLVDFVDSAKQIINLYATATWDKWMKAVTFGIYSSGMDAATTKAIATAVVKVWGFTRPNPYKDIEMNEIMAVIKARTSWGSRLILLGHSQGNFYSSLVYDKIIATGLKPAKSIGVVGLAVPYSSVRGGNSHLTSANDLVVDSVRIPTLNNVLSPTHAIPYQPTVDVFGHNLIKTYMAHGPTRDAYVPMITAKFASLKTVAVGPYWAPPYGSSYAFYGWVRYNPPCCGGAVPSYYWYYLPEPANAYTGGWSGYIYGTEAQATTVALSVGKTCYNYHIAETLRRRALGDYSWVNLLGGCWGTSSEPWSGSWWPYSGDGPPVFRGKFVSSYANGGPGSIEVTAGATCRS